VADGLVQFGWKWFRLTRPEALAEWLENPDEALLQENWDVARKNFSLTDLPDTLGLLFARAGWGGWA
jgi:hypothetical protein